MILHSEDMIGEVAIPPARKLEDLIRSVDFMLFDFIWSVAYISFNYLWKVTSTYYIIIEYKGYSQLIDHQTLHLS